MGGMGTSADAGDAPAGPGPALCLPEPTGSGPVGTTSLWLADTSRPDPWAAGATVRELMVSLWYPAAAPGGRPAPYMMSAESELQLAGSAPVVVSWPWPGCTMVSSGRVKSLARMEASRVGRSL